MKTDKYFEILEKVYTLTNDTTPRKFDCGQLCNKKCCKNLSKGEHKSGMALLPYEKEFLLSKGALFDFENDGTNDILICNGSCIREMRPFSCRIFPYFASFSENKTLIKKDIRAISVCPLITSKVSRRANIAFLRSIKKAILLLQKEPCFKKELEEICDFNTYLYELYRKMED